jgi:exopolyphosphatase/guanosine-5'-triphosphate,3'-diphosphate pyrophosphatase
LESLPSLPLIQQRSAVIDLGSNSVRLVVFEGSGRNPLPIFNEKAVLRLGRGLQGSGKLAEDGILAAITVLARYVALARAMGANPVEALATAAVRDASNGPEFVALIAKTLPGLKVTVLSGDMEAGFAASGLLCGIPSADGILADIGGGSLEVGHLVRGELQAGRSLPLGVIRLADRADNDLLRARAIATEALESVSWLSHGQGRDLYLVGGAFRSLARIHMEQTGYPLAIVHHYTIDREEARDLTAVIGSAGKRALERLPGMSRRRVDDMPFAAIVMRRLLRATNAKRVVFSASGLREGWYMQNVVQSELRADSPLLAACHDVAVRYGRSASLPPAVNAWVAPLFTGETEEQIQLREAACWLSDTGSHDHPEYRAAQAFLRVLRLPWVALDHHARAFLAMVTALRYDAEPDMAILNEARTLLDLNSLRRAEVLGTALRLAYTLSGGTAELLKGTALSREGNKLVLRLIKGSGVFAGESVSRRLDRLAQALALDAATEEI